LDAASPDRPWGLAFTDGPRVPVETLFERLEPAPGVEVLARFEDGTPGVTRHGRVYYVGALGGELADAVVGLAAAGLPTLALPPGVELARRGTLAFVLNHGHAPVELAWPEAGRELLSGRDLAGRLALGPLGVAVVQQASR
jgi:beta-galactosidase